MLTAVCLRLRVFLLFACSSQTTCLPGYVLVSNSNASKCKPTPNRRDYLCVTSSCPLLLMDVCTVSFKQTLHFNKHHQSWMFVYNLSESCQTVIPESLTSDPWEPEMGITKTECLLLSICVSVPFTSWSGSTCNSSSPSLSSMHWK